MEFDSILILVRMQEFRELGNKREEENEEKRGGGEERDRRQMSAGIIIFCTFRAGSPLSLFLSS